jgi:hypothetical protein
MEPEELAESVAITLGFSLPYLLGDRTEDEAVKALGAVGWQEAKMVWDRVLCHSEAYPALLEAARGVASSPGPETLAAIRQELTEAVNSNAMLAGELRDLTRDGSHASLFGMPSPLPSNAGSPKARLMSEHAAYIVLLLFIAWASWMIGHAEALETGDAMSRLVFSITALVIKGGFLAFFARKFELNNPLLVGLAALAPGGYIIAGLALAAYRPPHMTQAALAGKGTPQDGELASWVSGLWVLALFPLAFFVVLALFSSKYYLQFFENTFGILLFLATLLAYGLAIGVLWTAFWKRKAYTSPRLALASGMSGLCLTFVVYSVVLGPAAAMVVTQFSQ